jgi:D-sedoheptulose 7-phosphate isomerase
VRGLKAAKEMDMMKMGLPGKDDGQIPEVSDFCSVVPTHSIHRIQETQETLLHILWCMVHVVMGEEDVI